MKIFLRGFLVRIRQILHKFPITVDRYTKQMQEDEGTILVGGGVGIQIIMVVLYGDLWGGRSCFVCQIGTKNRNFG